MIGTRDYNPIIGELHKFVPLKGRHFLKVVCSEETPSGWQMLFNENGSAIFIPIPIDAQSPARVLIVDILSDTHFNRHWTRDEKISKSIVFAYGDSCYTNSKSYYLFDKLGKDWYNNI